MHTLIIGNQGQLGWALSQRFPEADGVDADTCDITRPSDVSSIMNQLEPALVFNTAAYNGVDTAELEYEEALRVNALGPGRIAAACRAVGARFMHFSTDYVFGDGFTEPIDEAQTPNPLSRYGRSKLLGEQMALQNNPRTFVVRTTGLYSHRRHNFIRTMLRHALAGTELQVVNDQFVSPTWVDPLAATVAELSEADVFGVYHVTAQGACTWYELAERMFEILGIDAKLHPTDQESWDAPARRPGFSALDDVLLRAVGVQRLERWDDMLEKFLHKHGSDLVAEFER